LNILYIIGALLAFGVLVLIHELGHFTLAKLNGVKVEEFSIGMGPRLFGIKGKETEYLIKALPIGGYVKMLGEDSHVEDMRSFSSKSAGRKLSIIAAGPIMNLLFAVVLFSLVGSRGFNVPVISDVVPDSPAAIAGIQKGDKIVKANNSKITTWEDFQTEVYTTKGQPINLVLERNGVKDTIKISPSFDNEEKRFIIGVFPTFKEKPGFIQSVDYGVNQCVSLTKQVFIALKTLVTGKASASDIGGPVTIIKVSAQAAKAGIWVLLNFMAFLSVQLGIFNIIPFPALDGGWIFILLVELISGKKIDDNKIGFVNYIGFAILMAIMVLVIIKDILYPISL